MKKIVNAVGKIVVDKTTENLCSEIIAALVTNSLKEYADNYKAADVLIIRCFDFIENKKNMDNIIFDICKNMLSDNKTVIIQSKKPLFELAINNTWNQITDKIETKI